MQVSKKFIDSILSSLEATVIKSSSAIMEVYASNELNKQDKKDGSPVTKADLAANNIILTDLKFYFVFPRVKSFLLQAKFGIFLAGIKPPIIFPSCLH